MDPNLFPSESDSDLMPVLALNHLTNSVDPLRHGFSEVQGTQFTHQDARKVDELLNLSVSVFDLANHAVQKRQDDILEGKISGDVTKLWNDLVVEHKNLIGFWLHSSTYAQTLIADMKDAGFSFEHAERYHAAVEEARWIVADPAELFSREEFAALENEAIGRDA